MPKTPKKTGSLARRRVRKARPTPVKVAPHERLNLADAAAGLPARPAPRTPSDAYTNDFVMFSLGAVNRGRPSMPALPGTVALYLTSLAVAEEGGHDEQALVATARAHKLHGFPSPRNVTEVLQGIRRTLGVATNQKDPVLIDTLRALVEPMRRDDAGDVRDRALLSWGFPAAAGAPSSSRSTSGL